MFEKSFTLAIVAMASLIATMGVNIFNRTCSFGLESSWLPDILHVWLPYGLHDVPPVDGGP